MDNVKFQTPLRPPSALARWGMLSFIVAWLGFQILFPLRHLLYPGNPSWTEEGHYFSERLRNWIRAHCPNIGDPD